MTQEVTMVKASSLVLDYKLYPRHSLDFVLIRQLAAQIETGVQLPPLVADKESLRLVDGWHRHRAWIRVGGFDVAVPATLKEYASEAEMLRDAMYLNFRHGRRLAPIDIARCVNLSTEIGMTLEQVAGALQLTPERLGEMVVDRSARHGLEPILLKRTIRHLVGQELTEAQMDYNIHSSGMSQMFYINQVLGLLKSNAVDWSQANIIAALRELHRLLEEKLVAKAVS